MCLGWQYTLLNLESYNIRKQSSPLRPFWAALNFLDLWELSVLAVWSCFSCVHFLIHSESWQQWQTWSADVSLHKTMSWLVISDWCDYVDGWSVNVSRCSHLKNICFTGKISDSVGFLSFCLYRVCNQLCRFLDGQLMGDTESENNGRLDSEEAYLYVGHLSFSSVYWYCCLQYLSVYHT